MKVITTPGKTPQLIQIAAERGGYIVCADVRRVDAITCMAREMGLKIAFPITFNEFVNGRYHGRNIREFYIDEIGDLARALALGRVQIYAITASAHLEANSDAARDAAVQENEIEALRVDVSSQCPAHLSPQADERNQISAPRARGCAVKHGTWFGVPNPTNTVIDHWVLPLPGVRPNASIQVRCGVVRQRDRTYQPAWFGTCTHYEVVNVPLKAQSVTAAQVEFLTWLETRHYERWQLLREMRERLHGKEVP